MVYGMCVFGHLASYFSRRNGAIKTEMLSTVAIFRELT